MSDQSAFETLFGMPADVFISVGDYFDYSGAADEALLEQRYYECAAICAVLVDVAVSDILDNLPKDERREGLRQKPVGAILNELAKTYTSDREKRILAQLQKLNRLRIRVVHPCSEPPNMRVTPDRCPKEFAEEFFDQLERLVDDFGGYSNRQFGEDVAAFIASRRERQNSKT